MPTLFLDTSALARVYFNEPGSDWIQFESLDLSETTLFVSRISQLEIVSAAQRKVRRGEVTIEHSLLVQTQFREDIERGIICILTLHEELFNEAAGLLLRHALKTLDSIHLSSALILRSLLSEDVTFVSADVALNSAAASEGLQVYNPQTN